MLTLSSKPLVEKIQLTTKQEVARLIDEGIDPQLGVVLVGNNPQSLRYIAIKSKMAKECGIIVSLYHLEEGSSLSTVQETLFFLSEDKDIQGIILQLPLPKTFSSSEVDVLINDIAPLKDVDGLRGDWQSLTYKGVNLAALSARQRVALPPMVLSVLSLLDHYNLSLEGKKVVTVGKGRLVGQPLFAFLKKLNIDVEWVDEETPHILDITQQADILITGTGQPNLITYQWVKEGAVVVDCSGDVHVDSVSQVVSALSPATGGVGPLTTAWLLHNTIQAVENNKK